MISNKDNPTKLMKCWRELKSKGPVATNNSSPRSLMTEEDIDEKNNIKDYIINNFWDVLTVEEKCEICPDNPRNKFI